MSDLIPKGSYAARGFGTPELGESPEKKTEFVQIACRIQSGPHDGRIVNRRLYFTENTIERSLETLRNLGCTFPDNDIRDFRGYGTTDVNITVDHESYEKDGETKTVAHIGFVNRGTGVQSEQQMSETRKAEFYKKMMGAIAASAPKTQQAVGSKAPF